MLFQSAALAVLVALYSASDTFATLTGDEGFGADPSGLFYAFADKAVHVVNPLNLTVMKNITADQAGQALTSNGSASSGSSAPSPRTWNDAAFIEDASKGLRYVFINEGDVYTENNGSSQYSYVSAIDATKQQFAARIKVGARPVHLYSVNETASVWSHSDAEGSFYVISVDNPQNLTVNKVVPSFVNNPAHGKLALNVALYPVGYGTNVAEQIISRFNISTATRLDYFAYNKSLPDPTVCTGTHTIVFSRVNKHLLIECVDGSGVLEWNTVNNTFVALHNISGVVTGAPADDVIFVGDSGASKATLLIPGANGVPSTVFGELQVPYNPDYPAFYSNSSNEVTPSPFTDYTIFFPLTRNTNINNIRAAGSNITTLAYMLQPSDCTYNSPSVSAASVSSSSGQMPGLTLAAASNPSCGACAPGINNSDPSQFNASLSGFGVLDLSVYSNGFKNESTTLLPAGAVAPALSEETDANQCSFTTENHRVIKRGGSFIATVASLPQPSIYIVDPALTDASLYGRGFVPTAPNPAKIAWVPAQVS